MEKLPEFLRIFLLDFDFYVQNSRHFVQFLKYIVAIYTIESDSAV